jgi:SOS-response transcriptional repressor LexA
MTATPGDRLKQLRMDKGFASAKEAADAFGWNEVTYRSHENGTRNIPWSAARRYALAFSTSPEAILSGATRSSLDGAKPIVNHVANVPLLGTVSAGIFQEGNALEDGEILVPAVPRADIPPTAQYALRIEGPSVNLRIADGAYAICARYDQYPGGPTHGQLVHVVREHAGLYEQTIKELRYTRSGTVLAPISSDPRYQETVKLDDTAEGGTVRIEGVVIGKFEPL